MVLCRDLVKTKGNDLILLRCTATYPTALHNTFSMVQETHGHFSVDLACLIIARPVLGKVTFKSNALQYCVTP